MQSTELIKDRSVMFLEYLRAMPSVSGVHWEAGEPTLTIQVEGKVHKLSVLTKRSYLERASTNAVIAMARDIQRHHHPPILMFARYVPRETGERLIAAGVRFLDLAGNMHLVFGKRYHRTILGRPETPNKGDRRTLTPAKVQVLFLLAAEPAALKWPVREIASKAGVSKSNAAKIRKDLIEAGLIEQKGVGRGLNRQQLEDRLLSGYAQTLRPKLLIGRFRGVEKSSQALLPRLLLDLRQASIRCALTGGPAADRLQHFYQGEEIPLFVQGAGFELARTLRLLPDRTGPVVLLRAFGDLAFWRQVETVNVAHPWLIYAELMNSDDPRAHEAGEELRQEFLTP
jgi:hypothetical protein